MLVHAASTFSRSPQNQRYDAVDFKAQRSTPGLDRRTQRIEADAAGTYAALYPVPNASRPPTFDSRRNTVVEK